VIEFADPFDTLLQIFIEKHPKINVRIQFGTPDEEPLSISGGLGCTSFPGPEDEKGSPAIITVDGTLDRGVQGTVDILAHELAHVAVGPDHEHDDVWEAEYAGFYEAFSERGVSIRSINPGAESVEDV